MKHVDVVTLHDKFLLSQLIGSVIACLTFSESIRKIQFYGGPK